MSLYSPYSIYAPHYVKLGRKSTNNKVAKGELCPNCGRVLQFNHVWSNWVRPDASIILNNHYPVRVCPNCGYRIYPAEMLQEYEELKKQKVLV